jgi:hypothetical protein
MPRVYRLSKIGEKLPLRYSYREVRNADDCRPGFEVYKGPIYSIANSVGPAIGALSEGDFTPSAGYNLILLIDVRNFRSHEWAPWTWFVVLPEEVEAVRSLAVADLHAWLRQQPACIGADGHLDRDAVIAWVSANKSLVESWLYEHSTEQPIDFTETIGSPLAKVEPPVDGAAGFERALVLCPVRERADC